MSFALIMDQENTKLSKLSSCCCIQWLTEVLYLWIYEFNMRRGVVTRIWLVQALVKVSN